MTMTTLTKMAMGVLTMALLTALPAAAQGRRATVDQLEDGRLGAQRARGELTGQVAAHDTDTWRMWLSAGRHQVVVRGDGDTDLDLYVDGASGRRLAVDDDETDDCVGEFYLRRAGYVEIRIRNLGRVYNEYQMNVR